MAVLWYQRVESFPAATPPTSVSTIHAPITGQRWREVKRASRARRPAGTPFGLEGVPVLRSAMVTPLERLARHRTVRGGRVLSRVTRADVGPKLHRAGAASVLPRTGQRGTHPTPTPERASGVPRRPRQAPPRRVVPRLRVRDWWRSSSATPSSACSAAASRRQGSGGRFGCTLEELECDRGRADVHEVVEHVDRDLLAAPLRHRRRD